MSEAIIGKIPANTPQSVPKKALQLEFSSLSNSNQKFTPSDVTKILEKSKKLSYKHIKEKKKVRSFPVDQLIATPKPLLPRQPHKYKSDLGKKYASNSNLLPSRAAKTSVLLSEAMRPIKTPSRGQRFGKYPLFQNLENNDSFKRNLQSDFKPKENKILTPVIKSMKKRNLLVPINLQYESFGSGLNHQNNDTKDKSNFTKFKTTLLVPFEERNNKELKEAFNSTTKRRDLSSYRVEVSQNNPLASSWNQQIFQRNKSSLPKEIHKKISRASSPQMFNPIWRNQFYPSYKLVKPPSPIKKRRNLEAMNAKILRSLKI